jgi:hypothetical protein
MDKTAIDGIRKWAYDQSCTFPITFEVLKLCDAYEQSESLREHHEANWHAAVAELKKARDVLETIREDGSDKHGVACNYSAILAEPEVKRLDNWLMGRIQQAGGGGR